MKLPCGGGGRNRKGKILQASLATAAQIGIQIGVPVALLMAVIFAAAIYPLAAQATAQTFNVRDYNYP
jgi:hypothetical protein